MNRYILIDQHSGFVWGDEFAPDPVGACRLADERVGEFERSYEEHGARSAASRNGTGGYFVYEVPADFAPVDDGRRDDEIERVTSHPCVAFVETRTASEAA